MTHHRSAMLRGVDRMHEDSLAVAAHFHVEPIRIDVQLSESTIVSRIATQDGDFALKIFDAATIDEPLARWRHELAAHAAQRGLPVPAPLPAPSGELTLRAELRDRVVLAQLSSWSGGTPLSECDVDAQLLQEIGMTAAGLVVALADAPSPPAHELHLWDLRRSGATLTKALKRVSDPEIRIAGLRALRAFHTIERTLAELPHTVVHQDLHDDNLHVGPTRGGRGVVGILDFGDATLGPRVADLVIPAAYASRRAAVPERAVAEVVAGWRRIVPLTPDERSVVLPLSAVRLATNAAVWQSRSDGDRRQYAALRSRGSLAAALALLDAIEREK